MPFYQFRKSHCRDKTYDRLISAMGFPTPMKDNFILYQGPVVKTVQALYGEAKFVRPRAGPYGPRKWTSVLCLKQPGNKPYGPESYMWLGHWLDNFMFVSSPTAWSFVIAEIIVASLHTNLTGYWNASPVPLLLTWISFNPSMDR